jgi:hypothetical protein
MLAKTYKAEPAAVIGLANAEEVQIGFVVEEGVKRLGYIFAVERNVGKWLAFDVRRVDALGDVFAGVSRAEKSRLRAAGQALRKSFGSRQQLAWAVAGVAHGVADMVSTDRSET